MDRYPKRKHYNNAPSGGASTAQLTDIELGSFSARWRLKDTANKLSKELRPANFTGTVTSGNVSTQALVNAADYPNNSVIEIEFCIVGVKADGLQSFSAKRSAIFRKNNAGTWVMDVQDAAAVIKESSGAGTICDSLVLLVNSGTPSATITMDVASGTFNIGGYSTVTAKSV